MFPSPWFSILPPSLFQLFSIILTIRTLSCPYPMASQRLPPEVDAVIVGNGPSALILSFILNGNIPYYDISNPHLDPILHKKLFQSPSLLDIDVCDLTSHFAASRLSYSTQALPVNVLLDTLLRPLIDTNPGDHESCVKWRYDASRRISHVVLGNTSQPGGQWSDKPIAGSWGIGSLSYAEMLSLPGYSFEQHFQRVHGYQPADFYRPPRREVAEYIAAYPGMVDIAGSVFTNVDVDCISRVENGFFLGSHNVRCRYLVLASGICSNFIPPPPPLKLLVGTLPNPSTSNSPRLVIGSGFTAADVILSSPPNRKIIHIFKWDMERPSPLHYCHPQAYPEYASVYRHMKLAANNSMSQQAFHSPLRRRNSNSFFDQRDWNSSYEGLPNILVKDVASRDHTAIITLQGNDGTIFEREISSLDYVIGRRGSIAYLDNNVASEIFGSSQPLSRVSVDISNRTLRTKVEESLEIAPNIFAIGSLTGDSLIRFAFGGCVFAAREIIKREEQRNKKTPQHIASTTTTLFQISSKHKSHEKDSVNQYVTTNGHADLSAENPKGAMSVDLQLTKCEPWSESGPRAESCMLL